MMTWGGALAHLMNDKGWLEAALQTKLSCKQKEQISLTFKVSFQRRFWHFLPQNITVFHLACIGGCWYLPLIISPSPGCIRCGQLSRTHLSVTAGRFLPLTKLASSNRPPPNKTRSKSEWTHHQKNQMPFPTNRPTNRAPIKPAWPGPNWPKMPILGQIWTFLGKKSFFLLEKSKVPLRT